MSTFASDDRDSRVLADVAALAGSVGAPAMNGRTPKPPRQVMAPVGPRHVSGTGRPGDPFLFADPDDPTPQGPHASTDALLWHSAEAKAAAIKRAEAIDAEEARKARRARMLARVAGARFPGDRPEGEED